MTTEEIEKEAGRYSGKELASGYAYVHPAHQQSIETRHEAFKAGAEFADKHWQEKTRWIPVEERLPKVREIPYWVVAKNDKGDDYVIVNIRNEGFFEYLKSYFTHWKEIEL